MAEQIIQGILVKWRELLPDEEILYSDLPKDEQYFKREEPPFTEDEIEAMADKVHEWTISQLEWKKREDKRFDDGVYAMINGILRHIPGSYWCYVNLWTLENGEKPDYREDEREFALFLEHCYFRTPLYGCTRPKGRRQGATSFGAFFEWFIAGRRPYMNCGTISFNDGAAADVFQNMLMPGFKSLLPCFQSDFDSPDDGKSFLRFVKPPEKRRKGLAAVKRQGLNSLIDYQSTTLNSYTNKRLSFILLDEFGRWEKLNCNLYWSKISKALRKGKKKVGFAYMPTVVNPKNKGGENYKRFFDLSDQRKYGINTPTSVVIFIIYGTQCYAGCIDKFGNSIIEDPEQPIMGNDGEWITEGSKTIILRERALLSGDELMEHRRDWPIDEYDIFAFEKGVCEFDADRIIKRIQKLEENPPYWRQIRLQENITKTKNPITGESVEQLSISYMDDPKGNWWLFEEPINKNSFSYIGSYDVHNAVHYKIGVDNYRNIFAVEGSDGAVVIMKNSNIINGKETGLYPVIIFIGRPKLIKQFNREVFKACLFYGCKANFELDAGSWFYEDFLEWEAVRLLEWTPVREAKFNQKHAHIKPGTESASPFQLAKQLEVAKIYFDGDDPFNYNGNTERCSYIPLLKQALEYSHEDRTPFHLTVAFMLSLMPIFGVMKKPEKPKPRELLPTYEIRKYA